MKLKFVRILIYTFISEKTQCLCSQHGSMDGGNPFCTDLHRDSTFSIVRYDDFVHGTAYLNGSTKSNDPGGGFFGAFPGGAPRLKVTFNASDGANEQKLLKIIIGYEDRWW